MYLLNKYIKILRYPPRQTKSCAVGRTGEEEVIINYCKSEFLTLRLAELRFPREESLPQAAAMNRPRIDRENGQTAGSFPQLEKTISKI